MSSLIDGWNAGLARTFAWGKKVNDSMYTYNPKTAGKQVAATVSKDKAPQLKKKATVIPTNPQGSGNKEKLVKATVVNTPLVVDTRDDVMALQRSLGFKGKDVDGIVGPMTNAAAAKAGINLGTDAFAPTPKQVIVKQPVVQKEKVQPQVVVPQESGNNFDLAKWNANAQSVPTQQVAVPAQVVSGLSNGWSADGGDSYDGEAEGLAAQVVAENDAKWEAINKAKAIEMQNERNKQNVIASKQFSNFGF